MDANFRQGLLIFWGILGVVFVFGVGVGVLIGVASG